MKRFETWIACLGIAVTILLCLLLTAAGTWLWSRSNVMGYGWKIAGWICILCAVLVIAHIILARYRDK